MKEKKESFTSIIIVIASVLVVAGLGSLFVNLGIEWFDTLTKPSQFVPTFVIPLVWTIIYTSFAIIFSIAVKKQQKLNTRLVLLLILNGLLNILWCLVFFTFNQLFLGSVVIILNLIFAYLLLNDIYKFNKIYSYILFIYPIWLSIATTLNLALWILN